MKGKYAITQSGQRPALSMANARVARALLEEKMPAKIATAGPNIALIQGTMLELVRRDGRDLTARQLTTLLSVYLSDDVLSVSKVAALLKIARPGVTRILDRLVEADLISRAEDARDRRRVLLRRTRAGVKYVRELIELADHAAAELAEAS